MFLLASTFTNDKLGSLLVDQSEEPTPPKLPNWLICSTSCMSGSSGKTLEKGRKWLNVDSRDDLCEHFCLSHVRLIDVYFGECLTMTTIIPLLSSFVLLWLRAPVAWHSAFNLCVTFLINSLLTWHIQDTQISPSVCIPRHDVEFRCLKYVYPWYQSRFSI